MPGLDRLFKRRKKLLKANGWSTEEINPEKLVVDGNQFCRRLYGPLRHTLGGGQYPEFSRRICKLISRFKDCDIQLHFVFDGSDKTQKLTNKYRKEKVTEKGQRSTRLPELAYTVLHSVLKELEVPMYVANGEGDETCAQLAKYLKCPVLSADSDFYLFDIPHGYIDLNLLEFDESSVYADVYYRETFADHHFPGDLLFLFPAIVGNGIQSPTAQELGIEPNSDLVFDYIWDVMHEGDWLENLPYRTRENFDAVKKYYNQGELDPAELLKAPIPKCPKVVPEWFLLSYRNNTFPFMIIDALVNGRQHHNSSDLTKCIRQDCYAILGVSEVTEYEYCAEEGTAIEVPTVCAEIENCLSLEEIDQAPPYRRTGLLYSSLQCSPCISAGFTEGGG